MRALTICQPYAELIVAEQHELPAGEQKKFIENRRWYTPNRGVFLIHAGKSREYMYQEESWTHVPFGCLVGAAAIVICLRWDDVQNYYPDLAGTVHCEGPYCIILEHARRFPDLQAVAGRQLFWEFDEADLTPQNAQVVEEVRQLWRPGR